MEILFLALTLFARLCSHHPELRVVATGMIIPKVQPRTLCHSLTRFLIKDCIDEALIERFLQVILHNDPEAEDQQVGVLHYAAVLALVSANIPFSGMPLKDNKVGESPVV